MCSAFANHQFNFRCKNLQESYCEGKCWLKQCGAEVLCSSIKQREQKEQKRVFPCIASSVLLNFGLKGLTPEGALQFYLRHGPFVPWPFCWDCQQRCQTGWYFWDASVYLLWVNQTATHFRKAIQQLAISSRSSKCRLTRQKVKQLDGPIRNLWASSHLNACLAKPRYRNIKDLHLARKGKKPEHTPR